MRLNKKVCLLLIALVTVACMSSQVASAELGELTLTEAISIAKANNYGICRLRLEVAKVERDIQILLKEDVWGPQLVALEESLKALEENLDSNLERLEQTVEDAFNGVIALHRQIESQTDNLRRIEQRHAAEQILAKHGLSTTTAVESIALAIEKSHFGLESLVHSQEMAYMSFNALLARPVNAAIYISADDPKQAVRDLDFSPESIDWRESLDRALAPK